ncbi:Thermophilic serine proteinase precursor [Stieleria neptunia]|uniref:Thermophilic serine proteinase n=1 Tax=Stieleria neptunia TaxID=2527979 RepID=A0A518HNA5_9BACT|nr:S8 family serine peptidase [Stieleria neptunia]QDV42332.1 Thermophilic serine proteinase precursor [Stieleria neptunia]
MDSYLDDGFNDFTVIAGLGSEGLMLVRGQGVSSADVESSLSRNESVGSYSLNSMITGQATQPNDSEYVPGLLEGLTQIGAEAAWDQSIGSMQTVVGVVDSGIDLDHRDLFLNIWINQGEIPADLGAQDIDGDGLITFYDLNNLRVIDGVIYVASTVTLDGDGNLLAGDLATAEQLTNETPYPSSDDVDNVIAVAASTLVGGLATFSNYGRTTVDIAAPGTGIRSTLKGGGYGTANGTSMATPHVAGAAALIWSSQPQGAVGEIRAALLDAASVEPLENGDQLVSSGGRLSASGAIAADVFAPSARVTQK